MDSLSRMGKAQTTTSSLWFIRITAPHEHCENKVKEVREWIDFSGAMVGYHVGAKTEKPHIHIALSIKSPLQQQSLGTRIRKTFGVKGAGEYSIKVWDGNPNALSYLYHDVEGKVVDYGFKFSEEFIARLKETNSIIQEQVKQAKEKAGFKVVEYVLDKIAEQKATEGKDKRWTRTQICECIVEAVYNKQFYYPGDFAMGKYIMEIEIKQTASGADGKDERAYLASALLRRLRLE